MRVEPVFHLEEVENAGDAEFGGELLLIGMPPRIALAGANTAFGLVNRTGRPPPAGCHAVTCAPCRYSSPAIPPSEIAAFTRWRAASLCGRPARGAAKSTR
jgi:hypothetical protein